MKIKINEQMIAEVKKNLNVDEIKREAKVIKKSLKNPFKDWEGFKKGISAVVKATDKVIEAVAKASETMDDLKSGKVKLQVAAKFLDEMIELPFLLELFDDKVFKLLISILVEKLNQQKQ